MKSTNIPMRRCIGCMQSKPKQELDRYTLVDGHYELDSNKVAPGRGVYICKGSDECQAKAKKRGRF